MKEEMVRTFWRYINDAHFDRLESLMAKNAEVWLPNTREVFRGRSKYISFNKEYPGRWFARLESLVVNGEAAVSIAKVFGDTQDFYVTSFFEFEDGLIQKITEYWGENGAPPTWRAEMKLAETY